MAKELKGWLKSSWDETQAVNARLIDRNKRWEALYRAGGGTAADFIRTDFGTDCPTGLDTQPWEEQQVRLEYIFQSEIFKSKTLRGKILDLRWGGWAQTDKADIIYTNPLRYSPLSLRLRAPYYKMKGYIPPTMTDILPHEFIHTRQHYSDHSGWPRYNAENDIDPVGMHDLSLPRRIWRKAARAYSDISTVISTKLATVSGYYAQNVEMQARMHEMLAYGYVQWQRLPTSRIELWAALTNMGLETPSSILDEIQNSEEGRTALETFKLQPGIKSIISGIVGTFNRVHDYAGEPQVQEALWTAKYPMLYGELIEFYGDKPGRARLGMGTNPRPVIEVLYEFKSHEGVLTQNEALEMADRIPPAIAAAFLNCIINNYPENAENFDNAMRLSEALLKRDDVKSVLFEDGQTIRNYTGQWECPPLDTALLQGHVKMTQLLMIAGADPFQQYTVVDMRGSPLFSSNPLSAVNYMAHDEKSLEDSSHLPRKARQRYQDPENRENILKNIKRQRPAFQAMLDYSQTPDLKKEFFLYEEGKKHVSLREIMKKINITRNDAHAVFPYMENTMG